LNLAGLANAGGEGSLLALRLGLLGGVIVLGALTTSLVALGWSWDVARRGLLWGSLAALSLYLVSCTGRAALFHPAERPDIGELWSAGPRLGDVDLFLDTLADVTGWQSEFNATVDITVAFDSPSLRWALRDYKQTRFLSASEPLTRGAGVDGQELPAVVITRQDAQAPSLAAAYRGQDFTWWLHPSWNGALPSGFARWLVFRQAPVEPEAVVLWARSDTLPGGELVAGDENPAEPLP
jgi:hypothetical protein